MLRVVTDNDFDERIIAALRERLPGVDLVRARDVGLDRTPDPELLEWAALQGRVLVTHDVNTMTRYANERIRAGLPIPGVAVIPQSLALGIAIVALQVFVGGSFDDEWAGQLIFLPL